MNPIKRVIRDEILYSVNAVTGASVEELGQDLSTQFELEDPGPSESVGRSTSGGSTVWLRRAVVFSTTERTVVNPRSSS